MIEATAVDSRRRLVLVRRDNVEHLIMLGGPTDLVVEANIVRAQAATTRDAPAQRPAETPSWPPVDNGIWPTVPEPAGRPGRGPDRPSLPQPLADELPLQPHSEPSPRVQAADRMSGFSPDFGRSGGRVEPSAPRAMAESPRAPSEPRRPLGAPPPRLSEEAQASDRHLTAMAQQLEAALRRPAATAHARESATAEPPAIRRLGGEPRSAAEASRSSLMERVMQSRASAAAAPTRAKPADAPPPPQVDTSENVVPASEDAPDFGPPPAASAAPPAEPHEEATQPSDSAVEASETAENKSQSLEDEMANLLGRAPGKA